MRFSEQSHSEQSDNLEYPYPNLLIAIGASAGGLNPIKEIIRELPATFEATLMVVTHRDPSTSSNILRDILSYNTPIRVEEPHSGESLQCTTLYVGKPNERISMEEREFKTSALSPHFCRLTRIDEVFRSVAETAGPNAVGVILSGMLDDGVDGLAAIHDVGGFCIVQNPDEAEYKSMPVTALKQVPVNYCGNAKDIAAVMIQMAQGRTCR